MAEWMVDQMVVTLATGTFSMCVFGCQREEKQTARTRQILPVLMAACSVDSTVVTLATGTFSMCVFECQREEKQTA